MPSSTKSSLLFTDGPLFGTSGVVDDQLVIGEAASGTPATVGTTSAESLVALASDAADGIYFVSATNSSGSQIYQEKYGQALTFTSSNQVLPAAIAQVNVAGQSTAINTIALDVPDHILYYESNFNFYEVKYGSSFSNTPPAPTLLATLPNSILSFALDLADHTAYFTAQKLTESLGFSGSSTETINGNYIYKLSGVTATATRASIGATVTYNVPYTGASNPGLVGGITVDTANDTVYFTTSAPAVSSADPGAKAGIYSLPANFTASTALTTVAQTGLTYPVTTNGSIAVDPVTGDYYFVAENSSGKPAIFTGSITTSTTTQLLVAATNTFPFDLVIDDPPTASGSAATSIDGSTARTTGEVQPGDTVSITVTFSEAVAVTGTPTLTLNDGGTATYASGSGTTTLVFTYAPTAGQSTATLAVTGVTTDTADTIADLAGTPANTAGAAATLTGLRVDGTAPTLSLTGTSSDAVQGGGSHALLAAVPTITDTNGNGILTGAKVQITSGLATGDVFGLNGSQTTSLAFSDNSTITLAYASGSVTLSGSASVADYGSALDQITLTDAGTHTATNSHPTQSVSFTVTEGTLTSTAAATTVTVDRAPAVAAGGTSATAVEGATVSGASGAALAGDTDADGDTLTVATLSHGGTSAAAGTALAGTYGSLTLNANGSYSYAATNTTAINSGATGAPLTDTFSYGVSDGVTTTAESFTATVLRPPALATSGTDAVYHARQPAVAIGPGTTLSDPDTGTIEGASASITTGLATGDILALGNNAGGLLTGSYANGILQITGSATVAQYQTALRSVTYASTATDPGSGGTDLTRVVSFTATDVLGVVSDTATQTVDESPACYCTGTLLLTEAGEVAVEDLRIGDRLVTHGGQVRAIRWIGRRAYGGRFVAGKRHLLPIRFCRGSLADDLPRRDLLVSPNHAMFLDGVLIPALALVNGCTIVQEAAMARIEYVHVELDSHDVIIAEGVPSESFVDDDSRMIFHNAADYFALYPNQRHARPEYCAPRVEHGFQVEAVRHRLMHRTVRERTA